jgi:hypothetical protein
MKINSQDIDRLLSDNEFEQARINRKNDQDIVQQKIKKSLAQERRRAKELKDNRSK